MISIKNIIKKILYNIAFVSLVARTLARLLVLLGFVLWYNRNFGEYDIVIIKSMFLITILRGKAWGKKDGE